MEGRGPLEVEGAEEEAGFAVVVVVEEEGGQEDPYKGPPWQIGSR